MFPGYRNQIYTSLTSGSSSSAVRSSTTSSICTSWMDALCSRFVGSSSMWCDGVGKNREQITSMSSLERPWMLFLKHVCGSNSPVHTYTWNLTNKIFSFWLHKERNYKKIKLLVSHTEAACRQQVWICWYLVWMTV